MRRGLLLHWKCAVLLALALLMFPAAPALAKVQLYVDVGWENRFRAGRWTPLYVTVSDSAPRQVVLEVYAPTDRRYAMKIRQSLAIGPQAVTVPIYVPVWFQVNEASVTVRDANNFARLADVLLGDTGDTQASQPNVPQDVPADGLFVGISGNGGTARLLAGQFQHETVSPAFLPPERLPATPVGYDALDLLVLNAPDLNRISMDQQRAIADWVRSGGMLVLWPGAEPVPPAGPLVDLFPCAIGENVSFDVDAKSVAAAGLPPRFAKLKGRRLTNPAPDAKPIALLGNLTGYRHWVGVGQVAVLPADVSLFTFDALHPGVGFWRRTLSGITVVPERDPNTPYSGYGYGVNDARHQAALRGTLDWIGNIPGAGEFGFAYLAVTMLAVMFIVGPVDWFVLKWLGRQPWTWVTITGWIGVVTFAAIYAGHLVKSGDLVFRTVTLVDEAGGSRVATYDVAGIYSPQTRRYEMEVDPESWWRPASDSQFYGATALQFEIPCHQDYRGNRPEDLLINVWNLRLLQAQTYQSAAPLLDAKLSADGKQVTGTITNRGPFALEHLRVRTRDGVASVSKTVEPGQSIDVAETLDARDRTLTTMPTGNDGQAPWQWYQQQQQQTNQDRPRFPLLNGVADRRAARLDQMLADRADVAVVYAEFDGGNEDRVKLKQPEGDQPAKEAHVGAVRAVVALQGSAAR